MKRSIVLLNLLLIAILGAGSYELRRRWLEARAREASLLAVKAIPVPSSPQSNQIAAPAPQKLQSVQYFEVAERFLFSRDRNPNVVIERKPEPPPKVMPNFPSVFGVMDIGMGPTVFMSVDRASQQGYKLGDKIGEFTLVAANQKEITFEWEGKPITKALDDLRAKPHETAAAQAPIERMNSNINNAPPPAPIQRPPENVRPAPGVDIGGGRRGCLPGDSSPAGTVADGYKKVSTNYAFGPICYWESSR
ncbi:MAG: hypothetical protein NTW74_08045 [Acidobacteria bacterium]|nr:hypothetical protein [Acidobacteriota bacterium]